VFYSLYMAQRTAQQIADAAAKRRVTQATNRANGIPTVRQARAAARAAKAGQPFVPPTPRQPRTTGRGRRRRFNSSTFTNPTPQAPVFSTPKPTHRAQKLIVLAALEQLFALKLAETGITDDVRHAYATYKKVKALALGPTSSDPARIEADSALRMATIHLVKLAY
jgi:hypothetical protein